MPWYDDLCFKKTALAAMQRVGSPRSWVIVSEAEARVESCVDWTYQNQWILINCNSCLSVRKTLYYSWSLGRKDTRVTHYFWNLVVMRCVADEWAQGQTGNHDSQPALSLQHPDPCPQSSTTSFSWNFSNFRTNSDSESGPEDNSLLLDYPIKITTSKIHTVSL